MNKFEMEQEVGQEAYDVGYKEGLADGNSEGVRDLQEQIGYLKGDIINLKGRLAEQKKDRVMYVQLSDDWQRIANNKIKEKNILKEQNEEMLNMLLEFYNMTSVEDSAIYMELSDLISKITVDK